MSRYSHEITIVNKQNQESIKKLQNKKNKKNICTRPGRILDTYPMKIKDPNSINMRKLSEDSEPGTTRLP